MQQHARMESWVLQEPGPEGSHGPQWVEWSRLGRPGQVSREGEEK